MYATTRTATHPRTLEDLVMALRGAARVQIQAHRRALAECLLWLRGLSRIQTMDEAETKRFWYRAVRLFGDLETVYPATEIAWQQCHRRADLHVGRGQGDQLILQRRGGGQRIVAVPLYPMPGRAEQTDFWRAARDFAAYLVETGQAATRIDDPEAALVEWIHWLDPGDTVLPALARSRGGLAPDDKPRLGHPLFRLWTIQWSDAADTPYPYPIDLLEPDTVFH